VILSGKDMLHTRNEVVALECQWEWVLELVQSYVVDKFDLVALLRLVDKFDQVAQ
jgi:hypothetical protein